MVKNIVFVFSPNVELHLEPIGSVRKALDGVEIDIGNCVMRDTSPAGAGFKWLIIGDSGARFEGIEELAYMIIDQGLPGNGGPV